MKPNPEPYTQESNIRDDDDDDTNDKDEVPATGYKNPPRDKRWSPGQSGNRNGRPKGRKNLSTYIDEILKKRIPITENGKREKIEGAEAVAKTIFHGAVVKKDPKYIAMLLQHVRETSPKNAAPQDLSAVIGPNDASLMDDIVARIRAALPDTEEPENDEYNAGENEVDDSETPADEGDGR